jgi:hypothetical protein
MAGVVVYNVAQVSFRQGLTPRPLLGRMNATMRFLVWGTIPLGAFVGGLLGSAIGVRETLVVAAAGGCLAWLPVFLSPLRWMRELPTYVEPSEPSPNATSAWGTTADIGQDRPMSMPFSRPGAIDLSALKQRSAQPTGAGSAAAGATGSRAYALQVDEANFQSLLEASMTARGREAIRGVLNRSWGDSTTARERRCSGSRSP